jgi:hypothetical protein
MAELAQLIKLDVIPLPTNPAEIAWKQYLFYMIAYCDTFHDFAKERKLEGEGRSVSKKDIPDRVGFTLNLIKKMDTSFPYVDKYFPIINSFKAGTFENNTYAAFTRVLNNPLVLNIADATIQANIKSYLPSVFSLPANEELKPQDMTEKSFQNVPPRDSSIIELYMPAVVYGDTTQDNFIGFLKAAYSDCIDADGTLKFVEDTASFPRNIFTTKLANFKKIITTQTRWDPAGLSKFEANNYTANSVVSAPSFRSTQISSSPQATFTSESAYFNQATNTIKYPGNDGISIIKAGPSVNHLFMHMALEGDGVTAQLKEKFKIMIRDAKKDSKKNMVLPLDATAGTATSQDMRLRGLTSSKRSGDYENIHSAIQTGSLMFTGDEPAFTYGVMNKCPIAFHSSSSTTGHHFRFYVPPNKDPALAAAAAKKREIISTVVKAAELQRFFGGTDRFYGSFLTNLKTAVFSAPGIAVGARTDVGNLLQVYLAKELELDMEFFNDLVKARVLFRYFGDTPLAALDKVDIAYLQSKELNKALTDKLSSVEGLEARNQILEAKLADVRKYIPPRFIQNPTTIDAVNGTLFKPNTTGLPFLVNGANKYKLEPGAMFPHFKNLEGNIGGIAKLLIANDKIINQKLKDKNTNMIEGALESLDIEKIPNAATAAAATKRANELIDGWLAMPAKGGYMEVNTRKATKRLRNNNNVPVKVNLTRKHIRNVPVKVTSKYVTIHEAIKGLDASKIPFKLSPQDYADMIVYRLIINDTILELTPEEPSTPENSIVEMNDPTELQEGGAAMSADMLSYCMDLFNNHIELFFRKHLEDKGTAADMLTSVLRSIVGGSFIQDIEQLLMEIAGSPEFPGDANAALYEGMKTNAAAVLNGIFDKLVTSYNDPKAVLKVNEHHVDGASFGDVSRVLTYYSTTPIVTDAFFPNMNIILTYLNNLFIVSAGVAVDRAVAEPAMLAEPDEGAIGDTSALQNYVKYALNDYLEVEILGVPVPAKKGGSRSRERKLKHKRGSPRRRSLRRK